MISPWHGAQCTWAMVVTLKCKYLKLSALPPKSRHALVSWANFIVTDTLFLLLPPKTPLRCVCVGGESYHAFDSYVFIVHPYPCIFSHPPFHLISLKLAMLGLVHLFKTVVLTGAVHWNHLESFTNIDSWAALPEILIYLVWNMA